MIITHTHTKHNPPGGYACVLIDQPGHGLSDGHNGAIEDWFQHVQLIREFVEEFVVNFHEKIQEESGKNKRKIPLVCHGFSLGGGIAITLGLECGLHVFDALVLVAPMLYVHDHMKPSVPVQKFFQYLIHPIMPLWPIFPARNTLDLSYTRWLMAEDF